MARRKDRRYALSVLSQLQSIDAYSSVVFSLGDYRRKRLGSAASLPADYFHPNNRSEESERLRNQMKTEMSDIIISYFKKEGGQVAIYDANNTTIQERQYLRDLCAANKM